MDSLPEVLVTSALENKNNNCSIYDIKSGNLLAAFKGGSSVKNGLCFVGDDYLLSALKNLNGMSVWTLAPNGEGKVMTVPGNVSCCVATDCGMYCLVGIEKTIYVWETATGSLLSCLQYHSQEVTCLRISCDGSHFISGGKDGRVLVWLLSEVVSEELEIADNTKPRFAWNDHTAEVTDIYVGSLSFYSRVATSSKDMTCRLYELETGIHLVTVRVDFAITAVTMDDSEYFLFLGSIDGEIYRINLFAEKTAEVSYSKNDLSCSFNGHAKAITCLSISPSTKYLVSGSEDCDCRLWDLTSLSIVRRVDLKGPVTNAFITVMPPGFISQKKFSPRTVFKLFKKDYDNNRQTLKEVKTTIQTKDVSLFHVGCPDDYFDSRILVNPTESCGGTKKGNFSLGSMNLANTQMYSFALSAIVDEENKKF